MGILLPSVTDGASFLPRDATRARYSYGKSSVSVRPSVRLSSCKVGGL